MHLLWAGTNQNKMDELQKKHFEEKGEILYKGKTDKEKVRENIEANRKAMLEQKRIDARRESLDSACRIYAANRKECVKTPEEVLKDADKIYEWLIAGMSS